MGCSFVSTSTAPTRRPTAASPNGEPCSPRSSPCDSCGGPTPDTGACRAVCGPRRSPTRTKRIPTWAAGSRGGRRRARACRRAWDAMWSCPASGVRRAAGGPRAASLASRVPSRATAAPPTQTTWSTPSPTAGRATWASTATRWTWRRATRACCRPTITTRSPRGARLCAACGVASRTWSCPARRTARGSQCCARRPTSVGRASRATTRRCSGPSSPATRADSSTSPPPAAATRRRSSVTSRLNSMAGSRGGALPCTFETRRRCSRMCASISCGWRSRREAASSPSTTMVRP